MPPIPLLKPLQPLQKPPQGSCPEHPPWNAAGSPCSAFPSPGGSSRCPDARFREPLKAALRRAAYSPGLAAVGGPLEAHRVQQLGEGWGVLTDLAWPLNPSSWGFSRSKPLL